MTSSNRIARLRRELNEPYDLELDNLRRRRARLLPRRGRHIAYYRFATGAIKDYFTFLVSSWARALWDIVMLPNVLLDRLAIVTFATIASFAMFGLLLWCLFCKLPMVGVLFDFLSDRLLGGASTANSLYPVLWDELNSDELGCAFDALSEPISKASKRNKDTVREVNLDVAKLLLQCAALMPSEKMRPDDRIRELGETYGLEYITLSEMNSVSSASCGVFFHPEEKFIIIAYKGTSPEEFGDWATDLTYAPKHAGGWIRGFDKCHGGFFSKVYPSRLDRGVPLPYTMIQNGVRKVAEMLLENHAKGEGAQVNVWTTGHSLGCSLASLVYARQINEPAETPPSIIMRDAYLFAAPIVCDITSVNAFDNQMRHHAQPRTLWRLSNRNDIVATGLPNMGDYPEWGVSASSAFSYAHLGAEIDLKPDTCTVSGTHVTPGSDVNIVTKYVPVNTVVPAKAKIRAELRKQLRDLQSLPVIGQFIAHAPISYWVALTDVRPGPCLWEG